MSKVLNLTTFSLLQTPDGCRDRESNCLQREDILLLGQVPVSSGTRDSRRKAPRWLQGDWVLKDLRITGNHSSITATRRKWGPRGGKVVKVKELVGIRASVSNQVL